MMAAVVAAAALTLPPPDMSQARLAPEYYESFFERHSLPWRSFENGQPLWPTESGLVALSLQDVERLISFDDPVAWAWMNLTEKEGFACDEHESTGPDSSCLLCVKPGYPWALYAVQAKLARVRGNLIVESAAEVGKTRDIVANILHDADTAMGGASSGVAADSDITLQTIWDEIKFQIDSNPGIAGGVVNERVKPYRQLDFANGFHVEMRLCGFDGKQFRGWHVSKRLYADECAKWKNAQQFNEFWRAGKPGCTFRIYSTPDGDYSSPFFALCARAVSIDGRGASGKDVKLPKNTPKFRKMNIRKYDLPAPMWTESRAAKYEEQYGGRDSLGWQTNIEGAWGSAAYSVFPAMHLLPCARKYLPDFRMVRCVIERKERSLFFAASRLSPQIDEEEGSRQEEILANEKLPFTTGADIAREIVRYFPDVSDWKDPVFLAGGDLGFDADPTELVFARSIGGRLRWAFRLHLKGAKGPEQEQVFRFLDHASGHQVSFGLDNGSAGSYLVAQLTSEIKNCPVCGKAIDFAERVRGFNFGAANDFLDLDTGETVKNPDRTDENGDTVAMRLSNKEASTRYLEKLMHETRLEVAADAGAGDANLSGTQLLMNHTSHGLNSRGERNFKKTDDHYPDAVRQLALIFVYSQRGTPPVFADGENVRFLDGSGRSTPGIFSESAVPAASLFGGDSISRALDGF